MNFLTPYICRFSALHHHHYTARTRLLLQADQSLNYFLPDFFIPPVPVKRKQATAAKACIQI